MFDPGAINSKKNWSYSLLQKALFHRDYSLYLNFAWNLGFMVISPRSLSLRMWFDIINEIWSHAAIEIGFWIHDPENCFLIDIKRALLIISDNIVSLRNVCWCWHREFWISHKALKILNLPFFFQIFTITVSSFFQRAVKHRHKDKNNRKDK
jgi:hypothetical protein